jgi:hypothetical protein
MDKSMLLQMPIINVQGCLAGITSDASELNAKMLKEICCLEDAANTRSNRVFHG